MRGPWGSTGTSVWVAMPRDGQSRGEEEEEGGWEGTAEAWVGGGREGFTSKWSERLYDSGPCQGAIGQKGKGMEMRRRRSSKA